MNYHTPNAQQLSIGITAKRSTTTEDGRLCWTVDVYAKNKSVVQDANLEDPLDEEQSKLCKWYLEQYVYKSPYSMDKAAEAARYIQDYWKVAIQSLQLKSIVDQHFGHDAGHRQVSIEILDGEVDMPTTVTVHQLNWELLEDPRQWDADDMQISVKRRFTAQDGGGFRINKVSSWREQRTGIKSVNLLLVVARNTTSPDNEEVDPTLASSILIDIRKTLRMSNPAVQLNIEIVRPGTFEALQGHLARAEDIHGPGYYHAVHFDVHGQVGLRNGKHAGKWGFLLFSHPESEGLKPCLASRVAQLLKQHRVHLAILTACQSARANSGDNANIAKSFAKHGVENVLAMSFKVSSNAASIFLGVFYRQLLINGSTFTYSVVAGRTALRDMPKRYARLGLQRELLDWFVPVIYSSGKDLVLLEPHQEPQGASIAANQLIIAQLSENINSLELVSQDSQMTNRDFDLLRLEKFLIARKKVRLHGPQGIGKSTFLRYAAKSWAETLFFDSVILIDFETSQISTAEDFVVQVLNQLFLSDQRHPEYQTHFWTSPSLDVSSHGQEEILQLAARLLATSRVLIILDHLHIAYPAWITSEYLPGALNDDTKREIAEVLETLLGSEDSASQDTYLICATHRSTAHVDLGVKLENCGFELPALTYSDSSTLARSVLKQAGCRIDDWQQEDHDQLDLVLSLLLGVPSAIREILPLAEKLQIPWRQFFHRLHAGLFSRYEELESAHLQNSGICRELDHLSRALPGREFRLLILSSLFWQEGTYPQGISDMEISLHEKCTPTSGQLGEEEQKKIHDIGEAMTMLAADFGLLKQPVLPYRGKLWVHPLLTVFGRPFLLDSCGDLRAEAVQDASRGSPKMERVLQELAIETLSLNSTISACLNFVLGIEFEELSDQLLADQANVLQCIKACTCAEDPLPLDKWPIQLLSVSHSFLMTMHPTAVERRLFKDAWEELRSSFFTLNGGLKVKQELQGFIIGLLNGLAVASFMAKASLEACDSIFQQALGVMDGSEKPTRDFLGIHEFRARSLLVGNYIRWLVAQERLEEAKKLYETLLATEEETRRTVDSIPEEEFFHHISASTSTSKIVIEQLASTPGAEGKVSDIERRVAPERVIETVKAQFTASPISSHVAHLLEDPDPNEVDPNRRTLANLDKETEFLRETNKVLELVGINGVSRASNWWPVDFDMHTYGVYTNDDQRLAAIENSLAAGSWAEAVEHHRRLMWNAWHQFDHEQGLEHLDALIDLHGRLTCFPDEVEKLLVQREEMRKFTEWFQAFTILAQGTRSVADLARATLEGPNFESLADAQPNNPWREAASVLSAHPHTEFTFKKGWFRKVTKELATKQGSLEQASMAFQDYMRRFLELNALWSGDDLDAIEDALNRIEVSFDNEYMKIISGALGVADSVGESRAALARRRWLTEKCTLVDEAMAATDFWTAAILVSDIESYRDVNALGAPEEPSQLRLLVAEAHLDYQLERFESTQASRDAKGLENACDDIISAWDAGYLPQMKDGLLVYIKATRLRTTMATAVKNSAWQRGIALSDDITQLVGANSDLQEMRDVAVDCREHCQMQLLLEEYFEAEGNRADIRRTFVPRLMALQVAQRRTPARRNLSTLITDQSIEAMQGIVMLEETFMQAGAGNMIPSFVQGMRAGSMQMQAARSN
jgi:hypothetical protein